MKIDVSKLEKDRFVDSLIKNNKDNFNIKNNHICTIF